MKKWGIDKEKVGITEAELEFLDKMKRENDRDADIKVLEIGSGVGDFLSRIAYEFPNAAIFGTEDDVAAVKNALRGQSIVNISKEEVWKLFRKAYFDYLIYR